MTLFSRKSALEKSAVFPLTFPQALISDRTDGVSLRKIFRRVFHPLQAYNVFFVDCPSPDLQSYLQIMEKLRRNFTNFSPSYKSLALLIWKCLYSLIFYLTLVTICKYYWNYNNDLNYYYWHLVDLVNTIIQYHYFLFFFCVCGGGERDFGLS